ncbi:MAG: type II toxin-antitoxin system VapC family toxin [Fimbriimonadales bacterium]|jgi:hypothetical protein|nr:type II toxin-antitoxin system VapC family toxin [Armatimonadota bacterium]MCX7687911.1 type II toxin-antitoxin system VapC family toxin [Fimbriimonadales bacterium]CUU37419.1 hypothetical protein DCOP10_12015 [Armatimonadetes bacterium DC]
MSLPQQSLVFLDTNIVMYAVGAEHPYRVPCQKVLQAVASGTLSAAIDTEIIQEILHRYGALQRYREAVEVAEKLIALVSVVYSVTLDDMRRAMEIFRQYASQGVHARDAIHAAIILGHSIPYIVSADRHFDLIPEVRRLDPVQMFPE